MRATTKSSKALEQADKDKQRAWDELVAEHLMQAIYRDQTGYNWPDPFDA